MLMAAANTSAAPLTDHKKLEERPHVRVVCGTMHTPGPKNVPGAARPSRDDGARTI
jgi:hypothetical protein